MSRTVAIWVAVLFLFAGGMAVWAGYKLWRDRGPVSGVGSSSEPDGPQIEKKPLEEFTLVDSDGKQFHSSSLKGKLWIASFFYASCPGVCRKQNEQVAALARDYGPQGVEFISITVDPARDTPSVLSTYGDQFHANPEHWRFLTGPEELIMRIGHDFFNVSVKPETHSNRLILIGRDGKVADAFPANEPLQIEALREQLDYLLAEKAPTAP